MKIIYNKVFLRHDTGTHPENKRRLQVFKNLSETKVVSGEKYLHLVHTQKYIDQVKQACQDSKNLDPDTVTSPGSYQAAIMAVGATVQASQAGDFALVRPPGHHAYPSKASGFCLFNNIAIAVQKLVNEDKKVLIFDFDGHFGDGTASIFYQSNKVLYWSLHQLPAFPGTGSANQTGSGKGKGYTINVPIPPGTGDDFYLEKIHQILPEVKKFSPDVVAISAGFDGYKNDSLLDLDLSIDIYYHIGKIFGENFENIFATLEGGYNTEALPKCVYNFIDGINGKPQKYFEL